MIITYHEIRNISKEKARELVRKVLEKNDCCVQKTAQILGIYVERQSEGLVMGHCLTIHKGLRIAQRKLITF